MTACDSAIVCSTSRPRQVMFFGSGYCAPRIHSTCSPLLTFHRPGPGCSPVTSTVSSVAVSAGVGGVGGVAGATGVVCAIAGLPMDNSRQQKSVSRGETELTENLYRMFDIASHQK